MRRYLLLILIVLLHVGAAFAQLSFTAITTPSTCSSNGTVTINATGGVSPFIYQIISSSVGIVRPAQNIAVFNNLPGGVYLIRVSDISGLTDTRNITVAGSYSPLTFSHSQQQSTLVITPVNGRSPFTFAFSADGGANYTTPVDSGTFHCMTPGNYVFRVYDSCGNFYSEALVIDPVTIQADFSCTNNNTGIALNAVSGGNGGYLFHAFGTGYNQTNTTGNFSGLNRCKKDIQVEITDRCAIKDTFNGCVTSDYSYSIACVNFKNRTLTLSNTSGGNGIPFQYNANGIISTASFIQNIPIPNDTILITISDSCGFMKSDTIEKFRSNAGGYDICDDGKMSLYSFCKVNRNHVSFPPTRYTSLSGPSVFNYVDSTMRDSSFVNIENLQAGNYVYKVTNACGDEVIQSFTFTPKCFRSIKLDKVQSCTGLQLKLIKDCTISNNALFTLSDLNNRIISQNTTGFFSGLNNDSCYKITAKDIDCDTALTDFINPLKPKIRLFQNSCDELVIKPAILTKLDCGSSVAASFRDTLNYILTDSMFTVLKISSSSIINPVPANTYWVYATSTDCNSDTLRYVRQSGLTDTIFFCISPSVRFVNGGCKFAWQVEMTNNTKNTSYHLIGNGTDIISKRTFIGMDTGRYILKDGCNEQELYLPGYYDFKTTLDAGCPSNAGISASYTVNSSYIYDLGQRYFFNICNEPLFDFNLKEIGTTTPLINSTSGQYTNLKNGTYYIVYYKGNEICNYYSDTVFTPYYTRPALTATYGLICNGNNATVRASVAGGAKPYTYEVINSSIPVITTDSGYVLYDSLPLGKAEFRVSDACGVSTNYSTEVLSIDFEILAKKKCDGTVQLIAPDIFNASYNWTNKSGDTIGTSPTVFTIPNGDDTFRVTIRHLSCTIDKTLYVPNFSASNAYADAGSNQSTDTSFIYLSGNIPPTGTVGTWRQINPSSGTTIFEDIHRHDTKASVSVFPGQYTYVWAIQDTLAGCSSEDTVVVSYLRCPNIIPILYTKTIRNTSCNGSATIEIAITQASTPVHFLWNTGDTSSVLSNLQNDSMYIVLIQDKTTCTPDIYDTTIVSLISSSFDTIHASFCEGDSVRIHNRDYAAAGIYSDTLTNTSGCDSIVSIQLTVRAKSETSDTLTLCSGESYTLPNGQTIRQSGNYNVILTNNLGCDSLKKYAILFHPAPLITIDTTICPGTQFQLANGNFVNQTGSYTDSLQTSLGCDSIIITRLAVRDSLSPVFIGFDTTICSDESLLINLNYPEYVNYIWQDNSTMADYIISSEGIYFVKVSDGCTATSDTIAVKTKDCSCTFYIPTAFTPNSDGINDLFKPIIKCELFSNYSFSIYNRWGEMVFKTDDAGEGWAGNFKDSAQQTDTYLWVLEYKDLHQQIQMMKKGILTLLR